MKRSEMIRKIKSIIATRGPTQPTIETAEQVLKACEDAGMAPPCSSGVVETEPQADGSLVITLWKWDEEDTFCIDCGIQTKPGKGSARCRDCWDDKVGQ